MAGGDDVKTNSNIMKFHEKMNYFRIEEKHCDVAILVDEKQFHCHQVILASASEFFNTMFSSSFKESNSSEVSLKELDIPTFEGILNFIYTGTIELTKENMSKLLMASEFLHMDCLQTLCIAFLKICVPPVREVLEIFIFAFNTKKPDLIKTMTKYAAKNFNQISKLEESLTLPFPALQLILKHTMLLKNNELFVDFFVKWIQKDPGNREKFVSDFVQEVDWSKLSPDFQGKLILPYINLQSSENDKVKMDEEATVDAIDFDLDFTTETLQVSCLKNHIFSFAPQYCYPKHQSFSVYAITEKLKDWQFVKEKNLGIDFECYSTNYKSALVGERQYHLMYNKTCQFSVDLQNTGELLKLKSLPLIQESLPSVPTLAIDLVSTSSQIYACHLYPYDSNNPIHRRFWKYNSDIDDWHPVSNCQIYGDTGARPCSTSLDNLLYVFGLCIYGRTPSSLGARFCDERIPNWFSLPNMLYAHYGAKACAYDGKLYVAGGKSKYFEVFDLTAGKWHSLALVPEWKSDYELIPYRDNIWVIGGSHGSIETYVYDPKSDVWSTHLSKLSDVRVFNAIVI